jgi:hypothetical protein
MRLGDGRMNAVIARFHPWGVCWENGSMWKHANDGVG